MGNALLAKQYRDDEAFPSGRWPNFPLGILGFPALSVRGGGQTNQRTAAISGLLG